MKSAKLKHPYITVKENYQSSFGGSQTWAKSRTLQKYGCGVVAGTDFLLYIGLHKKYPVGTEFSRDKHLQGKLSRTVYLELLDKMRKHYFPVIPGLGMPWWVLAGGLNVYFLKNRIPLKASFGVRRRNRDNRIRAMLVHDLPVILAVGPNFPIPWKRHKLAFYQKIGQEYIEACRTAAHFVVITGMCGQWLEISSWGNKYYVNMKEYEEYVAHYSCPLVSNIIYVKNR